MVNFIKFLCVLLIVFNCAPLAAAEDPFNFEEFAVVESEESDVVTDSVELNSDSKTANVGSFDIADVMLGMQFEDVQTLFFKAKGLYAPRKKNSIIYTMHNDWKYNLDYECRQQGIVIPSELEKCIRSLARNRGLLYASELHLLRENTGETLDIYFTSNATDNRVWKIVYNNDVDVIEGDAEKFAKQRENKILAFWQAVLDKYGEPNSGTDKWISSTNAYDPMMTAYYGQLELIDKGRESMDQARNNQQAREHFKAKPYAF